MCDCLGFMDEVKQFGVRRRRRRRPDDARRYRRRRQGGGGGPLTRVALARHRARQVAQERFGFNACARKHRDFYDTIVRGPR